MQPSNLKGLIQYRRSVLPVSLTRAGWAFSQDFMLVSSAGYVNTTWRDQKSGSTNIIQRPPVALNTIRPTSRKAVLTG